MNKEKVFDNLIKCNELDFKEIKIRKKFNNIINEIEKEKDKICFENEIITKYDIENELENILKNSVKSKNTKITIPIQNETSKTLCFTQKDVKICYHGDMRTSCYYSFVDIVKEINNEYIVLKLRYNYDNKNTTILLKDFMENKNIDKEQIKKFIEFLKEYLKYKEELEFDTNEINKNLFVSISYKTVDVNGISKEKQFIKLKYIDSDNIKIMTSKEKEKLMKYLEQLEKQQQFARNLLNKIKEFNMPKTILNQLINNN